MAEQKIVFNSSLPRSGSTLLQNILAQNPRFYCSPTSGLVALLDAARIPFTDSPTFKAQDAGVMAAGFRGFCRGGLTGFYAGITDKPVCVDKSRMWVLHYEWLNSFYPDPKILVCVRDLRAVLSSMEKLWRRARATDPGREADLSRYMARLTVANRVTHWLNSNPVGLGVLALVDAAERGVVPKLHVIRYEDLTANPKAAMQGVYRYLGEPEFDHDFDHVEQVTREDDAHHGVYGDHQIRSKVQPLQPDYWEVLGRDLSAQIVAANPQFYSTFYPGKR